MDAGDDSHDDSDDEFPTIRRLLSAEYKRKLVEEASGTQEDPTKGTVVEAMDSLSRSASMAGSSQGGCSELRPLNACSYV